MRYEFDPADARKFAEIVGIYSYQKGNELTFKYCPYCKGSEKDQKTFSINMDTGVFQCFRSSCGVKGNMIRLAKDFGFKLSNGYDPGAKNTRAIFWKKFKKISGTTSETLSIHLSTSTKFLCAYSSENQK